MTDVYSAVASELIAKRQRKQSQPLINQQVNTAKTLGENAKILQPYIGDFYSRAKDAYDPALGYYRALASGDRSKIMPAIAGQTRGIGDQYGSIIAANRALNPRSGANYSGSVDQAFRAGDAIQGAENGAIGGAYPALAQMAGEAGNLGAGAAGVSTNAGNGLNNLANSAIAGYGTNNAAQMQGYDDIIRSLYGAYKSYVANAGTTAAGAGAGAAAASGASNAAYNADVEAAASSAGK